LSPTFFWRFMPINSFFEWDRPGAFVFGAYAQFWWWWDKRECRTYTTFTYFHMFSIHTRKKILRFYFKKLYFLCDLQKKKEFHSLQLRRIWRFYSRCFFGWPKQKIIFIWVVKRFGVSLSVSIFLWWHFERIIWGKKRLKKSMFCIIFKKFWYFDNRFSLFFVDPLVIFTYIS